tara:strand:- start:246 stop:392 length:147 start_codon:yes stop_codon:yes gene_type:complete
MLPWSDQKTVEADIAETVKILKSNFLKQSLTTLPFNDLVVNQSVYKTR